MKSHASDLLELAACLIEDAAAKCAVDSPIIVRDLDTLRSRVKHEGISFLTITLPTFAEDLETCLDEDRLVPGLFRSFRKRLRAPAFLQGFLAQVFELDTGRRLDEPNIAAIEGIRQIAYAFKKLKIACTAQRAAKAIEGFVETEHDLSEDLAPADLEYFTQVRRALWDGILVSPIVGDIGSLIPKHGPGATAERISGNRKYRFKVWYDRLEPYFPLDSFAFASANAELYSRVFERLKVVDRDGELPVKVTTVPKTLKKPRIIAIEPVCMQYTQQAVKEALVKLLSSNRITRGHINFRDQEINRKLAMEASRTRSMATLDMSAASDRVPLTLAISMFESNPDLQGAILACRSRRARLPDGRVIDLRKFASMGSALCFPVEAMYFYTICVGALLEFQGIPVTVGNVCKVAKSVYVYGDDIIVPTDAAATVAAHLQKYYCKVNTTKSHWSGSFRESCGMDAYNGEEVTPTYLKYGFPRNRGDGRAFISLVSSSNSLYLKGYWKTAALIVKRVQQVFGKLPILGPKSSGIGLVCYRPMVSAQRWNRKLQRFEVKAWQGVSMFRKDRLTGHQALLKCLLSLESRSSSDDSTDKRHLKSSPRHGAVALRRRWVSPY